MRRWPTHWNKQEGGDWIPYSPGWDYIETRELYPAPEGTNLRAQHITCVRIHPEEDWPRFIMFHALRFEGGFVWDADNGWRKELECILATQ